MLPVAAVMVACGDSGEAVVSTVPTTVATTTTVQPEPTTTTTVLEATTTTAYEAPPTTLPANSVARSTLPVVVNDGPYDGWAIPAYIVRCESGGDYTAENPRSSASGAYQIIDGTWDGYGGYERAVDAPPAVQDAKAAELWSGGLGAHHWRECL